MKDEVRWMRVDALSTYLGIGISTIWKMVKDGRIKSKKISARITVFDRIEIDKMMANVE